MDLKGSSVKERDLSTTVSFPEIKQTFTSGVVWGTLPASKAAYKGRQKTVSFGHRKNRKGRYDSGGPFFTYRTEPSIRTRSVRLNEQEAVNNRRKYDGPIVMPVPALGSATYPYPSASDDSHLDKYGAEAISIVDPTNSNAALGVSLGEIVHDKRISLPGIQAWKQRTGVAKTAGSEYLAAQFGWLPLVSDMKATGQSVKDGNRIIENYKAAAGTLVHREFAFDDIVNVEETVVNPTARCVYSTTSNVPCFNNPGVPLTRSRVSTTKRWFSGSFTYAATQASSVGRCLGLESEVDKLFGLTLTPDVVWELTPWSWAIDWFSNAGNVISNATSFGLAGLVMKYGYMMEETSIVDTYEMPATGIRSVAGPPPSVSVSSTVKRRTEADPFGFGVGWEGLTPTQLAITAALGITRLR